MIDFTFQAYAQYIKALIRNNFEFYTYAQFLEGRSDDSAKFCIVRHDVDRKVTNARLMARLDCELGIQSSYYFRMPYTYNVEVIQEVESLGHEVGYHYESLSQCQGDFERAYDDFCLHLEQLRTIATVRTIAMHGRPLSAFDNRDMWKVQTYHNRLLSELNILGEIYLDVDYTNIAYINDTGRNWTSAKSNHRDHVDSNIQVNFDSSKELLTYFQTNPHHQIVFQIHPERWAHNKVDYIMQYTVDQISNLVKFGISLIKS